MILSPLFNKSGLDKRNSPSLKNSVSVPLKHSAEPISSLIIKLKPSPNFPPVSRSSLTTLIASMAIGLGLPLLLPTVAKPNALSPGKKSFSKNNGVELNSTTKLPAFGSTGGVCAKAAPATNKLPTARTTAAKPI